MTPLALILVARSCPRSACGPRRHADGVLVVRIVHLVPDDESLPWSQVKYCECCHCRWCGADDQDACGVPLLLIA